MNVLLNNPSLKHKDEIAKICSPLKKLNISYFSHVVLDKENKFSVICNNPEFIELYYNKEYFNIDLHTADIDKLGRYIIWDNIPRCGKTLQMGNDAEDLGIIHTFSMVENNQNDCHIYHFSTYVENKMINQIYLANIDLLKMFIKHFKNEVNNSRNLSKAHQLKIEVSKQAEGYSIEPTIDFLQQTDRHNVISSLNNELRFLTPRELECLNVYARGKTAKEVAHVLGISRRTVEHYVSVIKMKLKVNSRSELMNKILPGLLG